LKPKSIPDLIAGFGPLPPPQPTIGISAPQTAIAVSARRLKANATLSSAAVFSREGVNHLLVRLLGWFGLLLHGDQTIFDRWLWLRRRVRHGGGGRVLDAGCGSGIMALYAAKQGNEVVGLNWDERDVDAAQTRAGILGLDRTTFRIQDLRHLDQVAGELGSFDQIICFEVIEHIIDDRKLVSDLTSLLRPGGSLLLTTPSDAHLAVPGESISEVEDGGHVRYGYSHEDLRRLAEGAGLEVISLGYLVGPMSQALFRVYMRLGRIYGPLGWAVTVPFRPLAPFLNAVLGRLLPVPPYLVNAVLTKPA
jgi:2-polyprenyl-6-hydroxyphenyl methylase/3-demethylubiquinone-9 3-methyltransferase